MADAVVFRADAGIALGNGHVMRCLALADALRARGARCLFVCRDVPGHLGSVIAARGHAVRLIAEGLANAGRGDGGCIAGDAHATIAAMEGMRPDWLVVDHYRLDRQWEAALRPWCDRILAIDDLADRPHDCDVLLDQTLGRSAVDYHRLTPASCRILTGPHYALLRQRFSELRPAALGRRSEARVGQILVTMGGVDRDNHTTMVLQALDRTRLGEGVRIVVVLGPTAPWRAEVTARARAMRHRTDVLVDVADMPGLIAASDLAVGAAGSTSWERCCLGLPAVLLVLADNQRPTAAALDAAGAAVCLPEEREDDLARTVQALVDDPGRLAKMAACASKLCDGAGAGRVAEAMMGKAVIRPLVEGDLEMVLAWRNHDAIRSCMFNAEPIAWADHCAWFERTRADARRYLFVFEVEGLPSGFVSFTPATDDSNVFEWGFYKAPDAARGTGRRLGETALNHAFARLGARRVIGRVLADNLPSLRLHAGLGFQREQDGEESTLFTLSAADWAARSTRLDA